MTEVIIPQSHFIVMLGCCSAVVLFWIGIIVYWVCIRWRIRLSDIEYEVCESNSRLRKIAEAFDIKIDDN